ncbi:PREDICTED: anoctamin-9 [Colobus angolensis palliatus]|uniref:anoctamin-9 n=1 Tax=Colobus angolensis palliatus TaxID=336983 RepID=UPI0005F53555|nr:PREDICTED: anoctamin-9 [Colobus angolensis palliatus]
MEIGTCEAEASEQWDYVLVAHHRTQRDPRQVRQQQFLQELRRKSFHIKRIQDQKLVFFGIRADNSIFHLYRTLLMEPEGPTPHAELAAPTPVPVTTSLRIRIVNFVVMKTKTSAGETFEDLVKDGVFEARFPLHKGEGHLKKTWAGWRHMFRKQPVDEISLAHPSPRQLTHLFDNDGTVVFAIFMALWATVFLEIWKRQRARVVLHWDLYVWDEDQEEMALQLINCPDYKLQPYQHSYLRSTVILILSLIMICLMIGMAHILVVYRVLASALFSSSALPFLEDQVTTAVVVTGALVHYVTIIIMTKINKHVALKLCDFEMPRTFSERESRFTIRFFTLQFFTHFSSLIYIAFILGRINGHPGKSTRLAGLWKLEESHVSSCMVDPWVTHKFRSLRASEARHLPRDPELRDWRRNYLLNSVNIFSLFDEFMEMMIQYGFTTIFVAAFPLAPLLALFSNLVEIRLDAIKMIWLQRRLVPRKAKDIGTWLQVLETIGVLAVIANGMIIAFTSEFIPRVVYKYRYSPCLKEANSTVDCLKGYVNHSLSVFHTKDFQDPDRIEGSENVTLCRYRDYRNPPDYNFSEQFWFLLAIRLAFVILFEHVALCIKLIAAWFVPDVPQSVKNKVLEVKYQRLREKMWHGRQRLGGVGAGSQPPMPAHPNPASIFSARSTDM